MLEALNNMNNHANDKNKFIRRVTEVKNIDKFKCRDVYYDIANDIKSNRDYGHAICLVGLRRTGKSTILKQIYNNCEDFGWKKEEVLYIELSGMVGNEVIDRDRRNLLKINNVSDIKTPRLSDVEDFINYYKERENIECILIDEITLCDDLILCGKGFVDYIVDHGYKLVITGTESVTFKLANENSLYTRLILKDTSYISFGEYCRLKELPMKTLKDKGNAILKYIKHGNVLDESILLDYEYIESAIGINIAISLINALEEEFLGSDSDIRSLVESIIKYFRLIGEPITVDKVKDSISKSDISRAQRNLIKRGAEFKSSKLSKDKCNIIAIKSAEEIFKKFNLNFDISKIGLDFKQLGVIDRLFNSMNIVYGLNNINVEGNYYDEPIVDLNTLHSFNYNFINSISEHIRHDNSIIDKQYRDMLADEVISTAEGIILEDIICIQFIKQLAKERELTNILYNYRDTSFRMERKSTNIRVHRYRKKIIDNGNTTEAEIDLIRFKKDELELIEIKKSKEVIENQTRWLNNDSVIDDIKDIIADDIPIKKFVYYLGEPTTVGDVEYKNIADVLLEQYEKHFRIMPE